MHADRRGLVDRDEHRFAAIAAADEMMHEIIGDLVESVLAGDEVILPARTRAASFCLLLFVEVGFVDQRVEFVAEDFR